SITKIRWCHGPTVRVWAKFCCEHIKPEQPQSPFIECLGHRGKDEYNDYLCETVAFQFNLRARARGGSYS
ncbi:hypothetical protein BGZ65_005457, partial [Modicella reniformis]